MPHTKDTDTQPFKIIGSWTKQTLRLKRLFPQLTDTDLRFETDREIELLFRMQKKLKINLEVVMGILKRGMPPKD